MAVQTQIDLSRYRSEFPALSMQHDQKPLIFFDNPGGTQVSAAVAGAMHRYLLTANANVHGAFVTSRRTDEVLLEAHTAMADLLNAASPDEIIFGQNMTSLTFALARAIGRELQPGDEIVVTTLDHDANIAPWRALEEHGVVTCMAHIRADDCTLDYDHLASLLNQRTRLVAIGMASNAVGTISDVRRVVELAQSVGALVFVDAVQSVPHVPVDVQALGCDFLACSAYKFFGPHQGIVWGKREHLERLRAYKVRPASDELPGKWETGTQSHEGQAGTLAAVNYLAALGRDHAEYYHDETAMFAGEVASRRRDLRAAMLAIRDYEQMLSRHFLEQMHQVAGLELHGISSLERLDERVPTFAVTIQDWTPLQLATALGERGFATWCGHYYALELVERLGRLATGGMLRIGCAHYNTITEIDALFAALNEITERA